MKKHRNHYHGKWLPYLLVGWLWSNFAIAQFADINEIEQDTHSRIRISAMQYTFLLKDVSLSASGPEFAMEQAIYPWLNAGLGLGQAFTYDKKIVTLFTSIDISLWVSLFGKFSTERRLWQEKGVAIAEFKAERTGGLRFGLASQQIYFNTSTGAIPFSGGAAKLMYEFGFNLPFDVGICVEAARLANASETASAVRSSVAFFLPF